MSTRRSPARSRSSTREHPPPTLGYKRAVTNARRFTLDELTLRPGSYFNPQTEILIVVDDSPEVDHELFEMDEFESDEWVLVSDEVPVDEHKRDELVERFQLTYQASGELLAEDDTDVDLDEEDESLLGTVEDAEDEDELDGVGGLELDRGE
jgi:hypothetical protein